jgi:hypothetical protein
MTHHLREFWSDDIAQDIFSKDFDIVMLGVFDLPRSKGFSSGVGRPD